MNAAVVESPASKRKSVLIPQMNDAARVESKVRMRYVRCTVLGVSVAVTSATRMRLAVDQEPADRHPPGRIVSDRAVPAHGCRHTGGVETEHLQDRRRFPVRDMHCWDAKDDDRSSGRR